MQQLNNLSSRIAAYQPQIKAAVDRVISSGWLVLGPEVKTFEQQFAAYLNARHCVSVANGTDAIEIGLKALGIEKGDRVATVANAGAYTTTAVLAIGAEPYFMDVDVNTHVATLAGVRAAIEAGVKSVVVTHLYGLAVPEIAQIAGLCADSKVSLLEDCAQAHGAAIDGKRVGTFGDIASFSFYPTKNLGALGDGGAVVTNSDVLAERVLALRQYGWASKYTVKTAGGRNSRLDEMQAAILSVFLPRLDEANARRREIATYYSSHIHHPDIVLPQNRGTEYVAHLFVIRSAHRDALREHLRAEGIGSDIHYPIPDYRQPVFEDRYSDVQLPSTEQLAKEILTLPCYPEMTDDEVARVVAVVNGWRV
ncbi:DegT/DnrJ/EryC1/StrS family aminotransferase [Paraburkholderia phymatum]|uniref:DegT/DnrJ/EryC1/StrS family aminotransferase n=1 Tax=Paraburkholderia phymatum TaxID=148447 RepID=A0ACC6TV45_9BURK